MSPPTGEGLLLGLGCSLVSAKSKFAHSHVDAIALDSVEQSLTTSIEWWLVRLCQKQVAKISGTI